MSRTKWSQKLTTVFNQILYERVILYQWSKFQFQRFKFQISCYINFLSIHFCSVKIILATINGIDRAHIIDIAYSVEILLTLFQTCYMWINSTFVKIWGSNI